ncbi:MAG: hypothetical protein Q7S40_28365 [Opitutaceae bacterium]|nr:hypothetical protein [Opitutaceae bacterium]
MKTHAITLTNDETPEERAEIEVQIATMMREIESQIRNQLCGSPRAEPAPNRAILVNNGRSMICNAQDTATATVVIVFPPETERYRGMVDTGADLMQLGFAASNGKDIDPNVLRASAITHHGELVAWYKGILAMLSPSAYFGSATQDEVRAIARKLAAIRAAVGNYNIPPEATCENFEHYIPSPVMTDHLTDEARE